MTDTCNQEPMESLVNTDEDFIVISTEHSSDGGQDFTDMYDTTLDDTNFSLQNPEDFQTNLISKIQMVTEQNDSLRATLAERNTRMESLCTRTREFSREFIKISRDKACLESTNSELQSERDTLKRRLEEFRQEREDYVKLKNLFDMLTLTNERLDKENKDYRSAVIGCAVCSSKMGGLAQTCNIVTQTDSNSLEPCPSEGHLTPLVPSVTLNNSSYNTRLRTMNPTMLPVEASSSGDTLPDHLMSQSCIQLSSSAPASTSDESLTHQVSNLKMQLGSLVQRLHAQEQELQKYLRNIDKLKKQLAEKDASLDSMTSKMSFLKREEQDEIKYAELASQVDHLTKQNRELADENTILSDRVASASSEAEKDLHNSENVISAFKKENNTLKHLENEARKDLSKIEEINQKLQEDLRALEDKCAGIGHELVKVCQEKASLNDKVTGLLEEKERLLHKEQASRQAIMDKDHWLQDLKETVESQHHQLQELTDQLELEKKTSHDKISRLERDIGQFENLVKELTDMIDQKDEELKGMDDKYCADVEALKIHIESMKSEQETFIHNTQKEVRESERKSAEEVTRVKTELIQCHEDIAVHREQSEAFRADFEAERKHRETALTERDRLKQRVDVLEEELMACNRQPLGMARRHADQTLIRSLPNTTTAVVETHNCPICTKAFPEQHDMFLHLQYCNPPT